MDFQVGIADLPFAELAVERAAAALEAAHVPVYFVKIGFRPALRPRQTAQNLARRGQPPGARTAAPPGRTADRQEAGERLYGRRLGHDPAGGVRHLVLCGPSTSGVVPSTVTAAADQDHDLTVLEDACADHILEAHDALLQHVCPHVGRVLNVQAWQDERNR